MYASERSKAGAAARARVFFRAFLVHLAEIARRVCHRLSLLSLSSSFREAQRGARGTVQMFGVNRQILTGIAAPAQAARIVMTGVKREMEHWLTHRLILSLSGSFREMQPGQRWDAG